MLSVAACNPVSTSAPPKWNALDISMGFTPETISTWKLPSSAGGVQGMTDFKGKAVALFFGYTNCPDICPTTMSVLARARKALGSKADKLQVVFITVDPDRDQLEFLARYVHQFDPSFVALRGTNQETRAVVEIFKAFYQKTMVNDTGYAVDHTSGIFLIDAKGQLRALMSNGLAEDKIVEDFKRLIDL